MSASQVEVGRQISCGEPAACAPPVVQMAVACWQRHASVSEWLACVRLVVAETAVWFISSVCCCAQKDFTCLRP